MKRILTATFFGLVAGAICASLGYKAGIVQLTAVSLLWVFLNRAVMGFVIGVSGLKLHWAWNGVVLGIVVGSIFAYSLFMKGGAGMFPLVNLFANGVYGLMIEFFTTVVFKAPALGRVRGVEAGVPAHV